MESPFLLQYAWDTEFVPKFGLWAPDAPKVWMSDRVPGHFKTVPEKTGN